MSNDQNDKCQYYRVEAGAMSGSWSHTLTSETDVSFPLLSTIPSDADTILNKGQYICSVQCDSYYNHTDLELMRPGTTIVFGIDELEKHDKVERPWGITSMDTVDNVCKRNREWESIVTRGMCDGST